MVRLTKIYVQRLILGTVIFLAAFTATYAETQKVAIQAKKSYLVHAPVIRKSAVDKFYSFMVKTIAHSNIHLALSELYHSQKIADRKDYAFLFPEVKLSSTASSLGDVSKNMTDSMNKAATKESLVSIDYLSDLTKGFNFKYDLMQPLTFGQSATVPVTRSGNGGFRGAKVTSEVTSDNSNIVAGNHATSSNTSTASKLQNVGRIKGSFKPTLEKDKTAMQLNLAQENEYYSLNLPVAANASGKEINYRLQLPVYRRLAFAQEYDYKGATTKSSALNVLADQHAPKLNVHYLHGSDELASEYVYSFRNQQVKFDMQVPANKMELSGESFHRGAASYKIEYALVM
jgi:hypothetical protein